MELADQQNLDTNQGLTGAEIPADAPAASETPEKKLSLREQINKSVETVRTEEAKRTRDAATGKFTKLESGAAETPATETNETPKPEANAQPEASKAVGPPSAWKGIWESMSP